MARAELRLILIGLAASGLLAACVDGSGGAGGDSAPGLLSGPGTKAGTKSGNREIEAPEVFQTTDSALWDGRPSLGGIWVASPEVTDPERVVMFNPATGKSVTGALFKRERDNPGPTLQISSDAAEALGILAGQPTEIKVTALRKEEIEVPVEAAPVAADPATEGAAVADASVEGAAPAPDAAAAETAAMATAALDAADGVPAVAAAADGTVPDATATTEPPKKKTWKERRAEAKAKRDAEKAAKAAAKAAAAGTAVVEGAPLETVDPAASAVATIETAPLDARAPDAAVTEKAAKPAAAKATPETVEPAPAAPAATGSRPIQIASFSKEDNAKRAVDALAKIDIPAQTQKSGTAAKEVWGVVARGDAALLAKIKAAGFADAYFLQ